MAAAESPLLLEADTLTKSYAGVHALRGVSFTLRAGEVHALVGENGAGKSTLIRILAGAVRPDAGSLLIDGRALLSHDPLSARQRGIAVIYQQPTLFAHLSVAENLAIGVDGSNPLTRVNWNARRRIASELLARVGARIDPDTPAERLSMAEQQLVEIARALGMQARIVIMDEPTASLTAQEVDRLMATVRDLRQRGTGIVYISHRLEEVFSLADRITVLRDGQRIATTAASAVDRGSIIQMMIGREMDDLAERPGAATTSRAAGTGDATPPRLAVDRLSCRDAGIHEISLAVAAGEIVGLGGLVGAGRTELARTLFGITPAERGTIAVEGRPCRIGRPADAIAHGIAYLPEDRQRHGVIGQLRVSSNLSLATLPRLAAFAGWLRRGDERRAGEEWLRALDVRPPSPGAVTGTLSGGNQQKVALGRWLMTRPRVLILDEPTQGVDIGAKTEIHRHIRRLAAEGLAVLLISSDLPELLALSDRIHVMRGGRILGTLDTPPFAADAVMRLALGEHAA